MAMQATEIGGVFDLDASREADAVAALNRADFTGATLEESLRDVFDVSRGELSIELMPSHGDCRYRTLARACVALAPFVVSGEVLYVCEGDPYRFRFEGGELYDDDGVIDYIEAEKPFNAETLV